MASFVYGNALVKAFAGAINWTGGNVKVMLVGSGYTPNKDTDIFKSAVTNEVSGTGYTAGGVVLGTPTLTYDAAGDKAVMDGVDAEWPNATITARGAVVYLDTGDPATSPLIGYQDFGSDKSSTAGTFKVVWNAGGIVSVTAV